MSKFDVQRSVSVQCKVRTVNIKSELDKVRTKLARGDGLRQLVELEKRKTERNSYLLSFVGGYAQIFYISLTFIGGVLVPTYQMRYSTQQGTRGIGTDTKAGADMHQDPTL